MSQMKAILVSVAQIFIVSPCFATVVDLFNDPGTTKEFTYERSGNAGYVSGAEGNTIDSPAPGESWVAYAENHSTGGNSHVRAQWKLAFSHDVALQNLILDLEGWSETTGVTDRLREGYVSVSYREAPLGPLNALTLRSYGPDGGDGHSGLAIAETIPLLIPTAREILIEIFIQAFANNGRTNGSANAFVRWTDVQLGGEVVPEPSTLLLGLIAAAAMSCWKVSEYRRASQR